VPGLLEGGIRGKQKRRLHVPINSEPPARRQLFRETRQSRLVLGGTQQAEGRLGSLKGRGKRGLKIDLVGFQGGEEIRVHLGRSFSGKRHGGD